MFCFLEFTDDSHIYFEKLALHNELYLLETDIKSN